MPTLIHTRVEQARAGNNPNVICRMPSGWAVLGDVQFLRGYSLLLSDPVVGDLTDLARPQRIQYLYDMSVLGEALLEVTGAYRINYEILGNTETALHAHIMPRYLSEPEANRKTLAWFYDAAYRASIPFDPQRDQELMAQLAAAIQKRL